jgi:hypothetical protein
MINYKLQMIITTAPPKKHPSPGAFSLTVASEKPCHPERSIENAKPKDLRTEGLLCRNDNAKILRLPFVFAQGRSG